MACNGSNKLTGAQCQLLHQIPSDIRTTIKMLDLEPDMVVDASCPTCSALYPSVSRMKNSTAIFPTTCTHLETDKPPCNTPLLEPRDGRKARKRKSSVGESDSAPCRPFARRSFKSWIADMLARPGVLTLMRNAWDRSPSSASLWADIMDAPALRNFLGPDGRTLFSAQPEGSLHLAFSLFIDWFNPYGNKQAGKSHSIGAIYMACLNLPPHLRYRPENIYLVAIIPGPKEPPLHQINHLLEPLVDELLELWDRGVYLSEVAERAMGCLIRVAVIPLVCDLLALRKTAGFAPHSAHRFCSFCPLPKKDMSNIDRDTWPSPRSWSEHLRAAEAWRDAPTDAERTRLFEKDGLRWSQLLRLPYWDPTSFALVDAMHNLFLGELKHHCVTIWGLKTAEGRGKKRTRSAAHSTEEQQACLNRIEKGLRKGSQKAVAGVRKDYLEAVMKYNDTIPFPQHRPTKKGYAKALIDWVST